MKREVAMLVVFLFTCTAGCDTSVPTPYVPFYDPDSSEPVSSTEFCSLLARNTCAVLRPCCESGPFSFDESKCRINARAQCEARRQKSLEIALVYDDVQAGRCVRGTAILLQRCATPIDDPLADDVREACRMTFHGTAKIGQKCEGKHRLECTPPRLGAYVVCDGGTCRERPKLLGGDDCSGRISDCATGLLCVGAESPRCTSRFHALGAACSTADEIKADGPERPDIPRCGSVLDRFCDPSPTITTVGTCKALPGENERCTGTLGCRRPYRCDTDRGGDLRCIEAKPTGAMCNDDKECQSKLCVGVGLKVCVPSGFGPPIAAIEAPKKDPLVYLANISAACSGIIPAGGGSLAPFELPAEK